MSESFKHHSRRTDRPTPSLPLLHALLRALHIPIFPTTLSATSPSLLLIILETLLANRLPLPPSVRLCSGTSDEIAVIKCILGVLAHDLLAMDLTLVDPVKVMQGGVQELAVVIMALAVVAKRSGVRLKVPTPEEEEEEEEEEAFDWEESLAEDDDLPPPIQPDTSFSSSEPLSPSPSSSQDVFGVTHDRARPSSSSLFDRGAGEETELHISKHTAGRSNPFRDVSSPSFSPLDNLSSYVTPLPPRPSAEHDDNRMGNSLGAETRYSVHTGSSSSQGSKTVLQHMLEEFGLGLGT